MLIQKKKFILTYPNTRQIRLSCGDDRHTHCLWSRTITVEIYVDSNWKIVYANLANYSLNKTAVWRREDTHTLSVKYNCN